jgi:hypothetical protein
MLLSWAVRRAAGIRRLTVAHTPPAPRRCASPGPKCRNFDAIAEKQAKFLSGELLVPQQAARRAAFTDTTTETVATWFGVSKQFRSPRTGRARWCRPRAGRASSSRRASPGAVARRRRWAAGCGGGGVFDAAVGGLRRLVRGHDRVRGRHPGAVAVPGVHPGRAGVDMGAGARRGAPLDDLTSTAARRGRRG